MTTMMPITLTCPNCGRDVVSDTLTSTNYHGLTSDLRRQTMGANPLWFLVHTCQNCGFTGGDREFDGKVALDVAARIAEQIAPQVRDERLRPDARWEFAARIAEWRGQPPREVAQLYLNAAWCAEEPDKEHHYRRSAADWLEQAFDAGADDRATTAYLIAEMHRRVGDTTVAHHWYDTAIAEAEGHPQAERLREVAARQKTDPQEML